MHIPHIGGRKTPFILLTARDNTVANQLVEVYTLVDDLHAVTDRIEKKVNVVLSQFGDTPTPAASNAGSNDARP